MSMDDLVGDADALAAITPSAADLAAMTLSEEPPDPPPGGHQNSGPFTPRTGWGLHTQNLEIE